MKHLLKREFVMLDLETLSTRQDGVIVQIGAVKFTVNDGMSEEFLINIDPRSCVKYGLNVEDDTVAWWLKQPKEIRQSWQSDTHELPDALNKFNEWVATSKKPLMMANGAVFDLGILRFSFEKTGIKRSWDYWNEMDLRTIATILDIRLSTGNDHNALGDAKNQAKQFLDLFKD